MKAVRTHGIHSAGLSVLFGRSNILRESKRKNINEPAALF
jgi:hypothetical protein